VGSELEAVRRARPRWTWPSVTRMKKLTAGMGLTRQCARAVGSEAGDVARMAARGGQAARVLACASASGLN
jgi:hypothetical protein